MSQQAVLDLIKALKSNPALKTEMEAAKTPEAKAAVSAKAGFAVTAQDFKALKEMEKGGDGGELSDADLELVAGGGLRQIWREIKKTYQDVKKALIG